MPSEFSSTLERNQARGLKACINNPRVSETAKQNAQQRLDELTMQSQESLSDDNQDTRRVRIQDPAATEMPGCAAGQDHELDEIDMSTMTDEWIDPRASDEAREHAEQVLESHDMS